MAPVHAAARRNNVEKLRRLLNAEPGLVEVEDREYFQRCPLHSASDCGCVEAAQLLLDCGGSIDREDRDGLTPLMRACRGGHLGVVSLLLACGADPSLRDRSQCTALMWASQGDAYPSSEAVPVLRLLLKDGRVPVDARSRRGWTALHHVCHRGHAERARVLLVEGGADHTIATHQGETTMAVAHRKGHNDCIQLLEWYEGELEKAFLLRKARAVVEGSECISGAAEKAGARTQAQAQAAREEAAPAYLRGRVRTGGVLPVLEVLGQEKGWEDEEEEEEEGVVCEYVVRWLKDDLFVELMEGVRFR